MNANPFLGVFFTGWAVWPRAASTCPTAACKRWSWETYWLVGGFFSWIIAPVGAGLAVDQRPARRARRDAGQTRSFWATSAARCGAWAA